MAAGNWEACFESIDKALALDRDKTVGRVYQDPRFKPLQNHPDPVVRSNFTERVK
jgi:hypothetical protein